MPTELIYHEVGGEDDVSVFDKTLKGVVKDEDVRIVSPYIGRRYFEEITNLAESWRLITDFEEMVTTVHSSQRDELRSFLYDNAEKIRSVKGIHAKVVVADDAAVAGSANLTRTGVSRKTELSVLFEEVGEVDELRKWFDELWDWDETEHLDEERIDRTVESASNRRQSENKNQTDTTTERRTNPVSKKLYDPAVRTETEGGERYEELVGRVGKLPSRGYASSFFDLFAELIELTGLSNEDPRLVSSMPDSNDKIAVTVNRRYVLVAYPRSGEVGVTLTEREERFSEFFDYNFGTVSGESEDESPYFYMFPKPDEKIARMKRNWKDAIDHELKLADSAPRRKKHEPIVYRAAVDSVFRQRVLRDAF